MRSAAGLQCTPLRHFAGVASHNRVLHIMRILRFSAICEVRARDHQRTDARQTFCGKAQGQMDRGNSGPRLRCGSGGRAAGSKQQRGHAGSATVPHLFGIGVAVRNTANSCSTGHHHKSLDQQDGKHLFRSAVVEHRPFAFCCRMCFMQDPCDTKARFTMANTRSSSTNSCGTQ